jgi:hypothetical protein
LLLHIYLYNSHESLMNTNIRLLKISSLISNTTFNNSHFIVHVHANNRCEKQFQENTPRLGYECCWRCTMVFTIGWGNYFIDIKRKRSSCIGYFWLVHLKVIFLKPTVHVIGSNFIWFGLGLVLLNH